MKERPILFSGPMVRAILEGRKTQTRRGVKPQGAILTDEMGRAFGVRPPPTQNAAVIPCPYGAPGDRLWVRETWGLHAYGDMTDWCWRFDDITLERWEIQYRCDWGPAQEGCFWRSPVSMPRWASRITLEIEAVRVERLRDISENDASREGVELTRPHDQTFYGEFERLWKSINVPGSWDANPWVWVIQFRRVKP